MLCHLAVYVSFVFCPKTVLCKIYVLLRYLTCQCRPASCKTKYYLNTLYVSRKIYMCCFDISHVIVAVLECIVWLPVSWTVQANAYCVHYQCFSIANFSLPRYKHGQWLACMGTRKSLVQLHSKMLRPISPTSARKKKPTDLLAFTLMIPAFLQSSHPPMISTDHVSFVKYLI